MNIEGRALLSRFGFSPPIKDRVLFYDEVPKIDLNDLYNGNRCGASIEIAPNYMRLSDGPNIDVKLEGSHDIPRNKFFEAFELICARALEKGFLPNSLRFAICQSVPRSASMSGICARIDEDGFGYLACEILNGVRNGDFTPDYGIKDKIVGSHPMGHTREITTTIQQIPQWAINQMYLIMKKVNRFREGIAGVEFVLDKQLMEPIFHDMYWSLKPHKRLAQKFHFYY
jgi:hypothetical protein